MADGAAAPLHGLGGVLAALALAAAAHVAWLPPWVPLLLVAAMTWRWSAARRGWPLPSKWLRATAAAGAAVVVLGAYGTLNGIEAGTALLALMGGVKLLETRGPRDLTVLVFIAWFLLFAALLRNQGLIALPLLLAGVVLVTAALMRVHGGAGLASWSDALRRTALLLTQAAPLALALFLFFPRLPGPFWGIGSADSARTGLSDEMTPGDVSDLSASGAVAFRARFFGPLPPPGLRYWRGPVLQEFDGRSWRRSQGQFFPPQDAEYQGAPIDYQVTLEPHGRPWILALDLPTGWPVGEALRAFDFQVVAPRPLHEIRSFRLRSHPEYVAGAVLPQSLRHKALQLPDAGNARSVALGRALAAQYGDPRAIVQAMLGMFRNEPFAYTMRPPRLDRDAVDEFLFETRRGFCEHYASAFTVVMRAAGIPARVVTGYQGGEFNPIGGYLLVRQSDAHAWSEVWIERRGWVRVDPTAAVAPERIERGLIGAVAEDEPVPGRLRHGSSLLLRAELTWDALNDFWNERVARFDAASQFGLLERLGVESPDWRALGLGLAASLAVFFVALTTYLAWKFRGPAPDWPSRLHAQAARRLAKRGVVPGRTEGPVAYLERARATHPDLGRDLAEIRDLYVALRYGPMPTETHLRRLKFLVNRLRP